MVGMLFEAFLGWDRVRLLISKGATIDQSDLLRFHWALEDLQHYRPIQHIIGHVDFCGCRIAVCPDVLIPRPETEEMVEWVIAQGYGGRVLDLCTGSGCIAVAIKKAIEDAKVVGVDLSAKALQVARANAEYNGTMIGLWQADVLTWMPEGEWDLMVANPPYVRESERAMISRNVLDYEPTEALFVADSDPLCFYQAIVNIAVGHLSHTGHLVVEINEALAHETSALLRKANLKPTLHTDFRGKPRWIVAERG